MIRFALCLLLALAGWQAPGAAAQSIPAADRTAIAARVAAFDAMMKAGRLGDSLDFVPPRVLAAIAEQAGVPTADVKASFSAQIADLLKNIKFVSFGMDLRAATVGVTPDKRRTYMLIPTETVMEIEGAGRMRGRTSTLALKEGDAWYLVRIDDAPQVALVRKVYPEFAGVEFPGGTITAVE